MCTDLHDEVSMTKKDGTTVTDYSWRAPEGITCWEKAHLHYIPQGLFAVPSQPMKESDLLSGKNVGFQYVRLSSDPYKKNETPWDMGV